MPGPKRHHYLPQFYVNGFTCDDGAVWVYDRKRDQFRAQMPIDTTVESEFYTLTDADGTKHRDIEELLAGVESAVTPLLKTLAAGGTLSKPDHQYVAHFVAAMMLRTPGYRRSHDAAHESMLKTIAQSEVVTLADAERMLERMKASGEDTSRWTPEMVLRACQTTDDYSITFPNVYSIRSMLELAPKITPLLFNMQWTVFHAPDKKSFVTCDEPFVMLSLPGAKPNLFQMGLTTPGARRLFPLTQRACLVIVAGAEPAVTPIAHTAASPEWARQTNLLVTRNCQRFVLSPAQALLRSVVRATGVASTQPELRFQWS